MMNHTVVGELLDRLRTETRTQHESIEHCLDILSPSLTLSRYRQILRDFYGFYAPLERRIGPYGGSPRWSLDDARRAKIHLLEEDLKFTNETDGASERIPYCEDLPLIDSMHEQLGCMYVLEGSTLGGQHVLKHVAKRLNVSAERGASFFNSYGSQVGPNWRSFLREMQQRTTTVSERDEVVSAARQTFEKLEAWLSRSERTSAS